MSELRGYRLPELGSGTVLLVSMVPPAKVKRSRRTLTLVSPRSSSSSSATTTTATELLLHLLLLLLLFLLLRRLLLQLLLRFYCCHCYCRCWRCCSLCCWLTVTIMVGNMISVAAVFSWKMATAFRLLLDRALKDSVTCRLKPELSSLV